MSDTITWELDRGWISESVLRVRCRTRIEIPAKAYVVTVTGPCKNVFLEMNSNWHYSDTLNQPFIYVPASFTSSSLADFGNVQIPAGTTSLRFNVQNWSQNQTPAFAGFDILIVDQEFPGATRVSHFLKRTNT